MVLLGSAAGIVPARSGPSRLVQNYFQQFLNAVPQEKYETVTMKPGMLEKDYQNEWCRADFGVKEHVLPDLARVDCLTKEYAIEFDFAKKWAESVGQALYYGKETNRQPAVVLILDKPEDMKYVNRIAKIDAGIKIFLIKTY